MKKRIKIQKETKMIEEKRNKEKKEKGEEEV